MAKKGRDVCQILLMDSALHLFIYIEFFPLLMADVSFCYIQVSCGIIALIIQSYSVN